jgi:hypothetical protein
MGVGRPRRGAQGALLGVKVLLRGAGGLLAGVAEQLPFDGADANKTVTYWLRWVSTRGEAGPWSAAVSATVPG